VRFRNHLYNIGYKKSFSFETRVLSVGNLSLGGNGKTPMVEYFVRLVCDEFSTAVLSRGYGRSSKGFKLATAGDTVDNLGDEPLQMYLKFHPRIEVAVGESRALAIPNILLDRPNTELVILDDAFQHRSVVPNLSILVTDYWNPFFNDQVIPAGRLREPKSGVSRADIIVVTKCPFNLKKEEQQNYFKLIRKYHQHVPIYFTTIAYQDPVHFIKGTSAVSGVNVLLLTGIAKPESMVDYVSKQFNLIDHIRYRDHFRY
jgi:tetraacyldisaccharide 4'-kinase